MSAEPIVSARVIAALLVCGLLCIFIPAASAVILKLKYRKVSLLSALWGAVAFVIAVLVLEQLLHTVMLPIVIKTKIWIYALYGAFAAAIFEETTRFIVFKTVMKKKTDPVDGIMYGIGHGGIESALVVGMSLLNSAIIGIIVNVIGEEEAVATLGVTYGQITALHTQRVGMCFISLFERVIVMILHVALSVWVFYAARDKKKFWLFPAALLMHAAVDYPTVLFQRGVFSLWTVYALNIVIDVIAVLVVVKLFIREKKENNEVLKE